MFEKIIPIIPSPFLSMKNIIENQFHAFVNFSPEQKKANIIGILDDPEGYSSIINALDNRIVRYLQSDYERVAFHNMKLRSNDKFSVVDLGHSLTNITAPNQKHVLKLLKIRKYSVLSDLLDELKQQEHAPNTKLIGVLERNLESAKLGLETVGTKIQTFLGVLSQFSETDPFGKTITDPLTNSPQNKVHFIIKGNVYQDWKNILNGRLQHYTEFCNHIKAPVVVLGVIGLSWMLAVFKQHSENA